MKRLLLALLVLPTLINSLHAQTAVAPSGTGTSGDAYQITTLNNLYWVTQNSGSWGAYFEQTADIDASTSSGWDGGSGFLPIGSSGTNFSGNYDGQGYAIDGLTINRSSTFGVGLFGYTDGATISNLGVTNANITGNGYVGGFVGYAENSTISDCYSTGAVTGNSFGVGGFVGINDGTSTISTCYSTCSASSSGNQQVGGFVGRNRFYADGSTIQNCYARGAADSDGTLYGGGFAGINNSGGTIINCYSTGTVDATDGGGNPNEVGFSGGNNDTITDCFWDTQTSGITDSAFPMNTTAYAKQNNLYAKNAYAQQSKEGLERYKELLDISKRDYPNLIHCGRHAEFRYIGMPETVDSAYRLVEEQF